MVQEIMQLYQMPSKSRLILTLNQQTSRVVLRIMLAGHSYQYLLNQAMVLLLGSKEIDTINNSDIYDTYKDLYLSNKERRPMV